MKIKPIKIIPLLILLLYLPVCLYALPQDLETFIDFEGVTVEGTEFVIGESPFTIRVINFTLETVDNPNLAHSGTQALVLVPGAQEGKIIFERGVNHLQFYAAETDGAGRIELRERGLQVITEQGIAEGLPTNINPDVSPAFQSFTAFSGDAQDTSDLNFVNGVIELKVTNVTGQFSLDDLGFTYVVGPPNNTLFEDFEGLNIHPVLSDFTARVNFTLGQSPATVTFTGGIAQVVFDIPAFNHSLPIDFSRNDGRAVWAVLNDTTGTITFETPAAQVQFYAASFISGDGEINVFDTEDILLTSTDEIPQSINIASIVPFTFFDFNAAELGAPGGIGKVTYTNSAETDTSGSFQLISIDDFGFTPIGAPDSDTAVITVAAPSVPLVLDGSGDIAGEDIQHANGNVFDQILLTGESVQLQVKTGQITRVSFMDENEDIVQVEFSGNGTFTVTLDPATFLPPAIPPRYNQQVEYVTGKPSVVIDGADANTFFSIFTVGRINAFNQALFPEGQVYDAQADVALVEVVNSTGLGGVQLSNAVFSGSTGKVGFDARGVPIAVRLTIGDIDADGDAVPHILFADGSFTIPAGNPGLRITGGDLLQTNGVAVVVAESGSTTTGFDTLITQNNFKSDETPQPTQSIDATFANEDGDEITVAIDEITIE